MVGAATGMQLPDATTACVCLYEGGTDLSGIFKNGAFGTRSLL